MKPMLSYTKRTSDGRTADGSRLWDLETWDVRQPWTAEKPWPSVPADASKDYGYIDSDGQQHVVFRRVSRKPKADEIR